MALGQVDDYIGSYADDAAATASLAARGWPAAATIGMMYLDSTLSVLKIWDGTAWQYLTGQGPAFPGIDLEQVLFVDEGSNAAGSADGSASKPYQTIAAAYTQAKTLSPTVTNPVTVFIWGGHYDENLTLDTSHINLVGIGKKESVIRRTGGVNPTITIEDIEVEIRSLGIGATVNGNPAISAGLDSTTIRLHDCDVFANGNTTAAAALVASAAIKIEIVDCELRSPGASGTYTVVYFNDSDVYCEARNTTWYAGSNSVGRFDANQCAMVRLVSCRGISEVEGGYGQLDLGSVTEAYIIGCHIDAYNNIAIDITNNNCTVYVVGCYLSGGTGAYATIFATSIGCEIHVSGCTLQGAGYSLASNSYLTTPAVIAGNVMQGGMTQYFRTADARKRVGAASFTGMDWYKDLSSAILSIWENDAIIDVLEDQTLTAPIAVPGYKFEVRGNGYAVSRGANQIFDLSTTSADMTLTGLRMTGVLEMDQAGIALRMRDCKLDGRINITSTCTSTSILSLDRVTINGDSTNHFGIYCNDSTALIYIWRSYIKGYEGFAAIDNLVDNPNLKIAYSVIIHGDDDESDPITATGTPAFSSHHNAYNADPSTAGYANNIATPYDVVDVDADWAWAIMA